LGDPPAPPEGEADGGQVVATVWNQAAMNCGTMPLQP